MEPVIPHTCWEISEKLFGRKNLGKQELLEEVFVEDSVAYGVGVNGKNRASIEVPADAGKEEIIAAAKEAVSKWIEGKEIVKEIVVPKKLVNLVVKG